MEKVADSDAYDLEGVVIGLTVEETKEGGTRGIEAEGKVCKTEFMPAWVDSKKSL